MARVTKRPAQPVPYDVVLEMSQDEANELVLFLAQSDIGTLRPELFKSVYVPLYDNGYGGWCDLSH